MFGGRGVHMGVDSDFPAGGVIVEWLQNLALWFYDNAGLRWFAENVIGPTSVAILEWLILAADAVMYGVLSALAFILDAAALLAWFALAGSLLFFRVKTRLATLGRFAALTGLRIALTGVLLLGLTFYMAQLVTSYVDGIMADLALGSGFASADFYSLFSAGVAGTRGFGVSAPYGGLMPAMAHVFAYIFAAVPGTPPPQPWPCDFASSVCGSLAVSPGSDFYARQRGYHVAGFVSYFLHVLWLGPGIQLLLIAYLVRFVLERFIFNVRVAG